MSTFKSGSGVGVVAGGGGLTTNGSLSAGPIGSGVGGVSSSSGGGGVVVGGGTVVVGTVDLVNMPGGTVAPGTPNSKAKEASSPRIKIVVALYPFKAIEGGDLSLEKVCVEVFFFYSFIFTLVLYIEC